MRLLYVLFAVLVTAVSLRAQSYQSNLTLSSNSPACNGQSFQINAVRSVPPSGTTTSFRWSGPNSFTSNSFATLTVPASATTAGVYSVTMTFSGTNNGTATASTTVAVGTPKPDAQVFDGQYFNSYGISICGPTSLSLAAYPDQTHSNNSAMYQWTGPNGFSSTEPRPVVALGVAGNYIVEATYPNGCGTGKDTVTISSYSFTPSVFVGTYLTGPNQPFTSTFCPGTAAEFRASTSTVPTGTTTSYQWSGPNGFTSTAQNFTLTNLTTAMAGSYSVVATFSGTCSATATRTQSIQVGVPSMGAYSSAANGTGGSSSSIFCPGSIFRLYAVPANAQSYRWSGPNGFASTAQSITLTNATTAMGGVYSVTVTFAEGCSNTAVATVTISTPKPAAYISYISSEGYTIGSPSYQICGPTNLSLIANNQAGSSNPATYQWTGPNGFSSNQQNPVVAQGVTGLYIVEATYPNGCGTGKDTVTISSFTPSVFVGTYLTGPNQPFTSTFCPGTAAEFRASTSTVPTGTTTSYQWSGPNGFTSTAQNFTLTNLTTAMAGSYSVVATFSGTCSATATRTQSIQVGTPSTSISSYTIEPAPVYSRLFCPGSTFRLDAQSIGTATYQWAGPNGFISSAQSITFTNATTAITGLYSVTATFSGACSGTSISSVYVKIGANTPVVTASGTFTGPNQPITLSASGCDTYDEQAIWSTGATGNTLIVTPAQSMTYSAVCRLTNGGCDGATSNVISVTVTNAPPVDLRLSMLVSTRTPEINTPVRVTVLLENRSNQDATGVQWQCRLPGAGVTDVCSAGAWGSACQWRSQQQSGSDFRQQHAGILIYRCTNSQRHVPAGESDHHDRQP